MREDNLKTVIRGSALLKDFDYRCERVMRKACVSLEVRLRYSDFNNPTSCQSSRECDKRINNRIGKARENTLHVRRAKERITSQRFIGVSFADPYFSRGSHSTASRSHFSIDESLSYFSPTERVRVGENNFRARTKREVAATCLDGGNSWPFRTDILPTLGRSVLCANDPFAERRGRKTGARYTYVCMSHIAHGYAWEARVSVRAKIGQIDRAFSAYQVLCITRDRDWLITRSRNLRLPSRRGHAK